MKGKGLRGRRNVSTGLPVGRVTDHLCLVIISSSFPLLAPLNFSTTFLFLMKTKVGIAVISYWAAMSSVSSTSTLRNTTTSFIETDIFSISGAIILHGPHHVAKKSMTTSFWPADSNWEARSFCRRFQRPVSCLPWVKGHPLTLSVTWCTLWAIVFTPSRSSSQRRKTVSDGRRSGWQSLYGLYVLYVLYPDSERSRLQETEYRLYIHYMYMKHTSVKSNKRASLLPTIHQMALIKDTAEKSCCTFWLQNSGSTFILFCLHPDLLPLLHHRTKSRKIKNSWSCEQRLLLKLAFCWLFSLSANCLFDQSKSWNALPAHESYCILFVYSLARMEQQQ